MNYEYGQTPSQDITEVLRSVPLGHRNALTVSDEGLRGRIEAALEPLGVWGEQQSNQSIEAGIRDAAWLVETGNASENLRQMDFYDDMFIRADFDDAQSVEYNIDFESPVQVSPDCVRGAFGFGSWLGRGKDGSGGVDAYGSSRAKIFDFASRPTKLPPVELSLYVSDAGSTLMAHSSHRAAAAKLRHETLDCSYLRVFDARQMR